MTVRVGAQLVGIRADSSATLTVLRSLLRVWIDDGHPDVPWVFDVHLGAGPDSVRGPRPVPQLRVGRTLAARSRHPGDVLRALASVLGGVLARQDETRVWIGMRSFAGPAGVVLVEARPPALSADRALTLAGVTEMPTWCVALDGSSIHVPPPLERLDWEAVGLEPPPREPRPAELVGLVALDDAATRRDDDRSVSGDAAMLTRFGVRHTSAAWFSTVERLIRDRRVAASPDRSSVRRRIIELAGR